MEILNRSRDKATVKQDVDVAREVLSKLEEELEQVTKNALIGKRYKQDDTEIEIVGTITGNIDTVAVITTRKTTMNLSTLQATSTEL